MSFKKIIFSLGVLLGGVGLFMLPRVWAADPPVDAQCIESRQTFAINTRSYLKGFQRLSIIMESSLKSVVGADNIFSASDLASFQAAFQSVLARISPDKETRVLIYMGGGGQCGRDLASVQIGNYVSITEENLKASIMKLPKNVSVEFMVDSCFGGRFGKMVEALNAEGWNIGFTVSTSPEDILLVAVVSPKPGSIPEPFSEGVAGPVSRRLKVLGDINQLSTLALRSNMKSIQQEVRLEQRSLTLSPEFMSEHLNGEGEYWRYAEENGQPVMYGNNKVQEVLRPSDGTWIRVAIDPGDGIFPKVVEGPVTCKVAPVGVPVSSCSEEIASVTLKELWDISREARLRRHDPQLTAEAYAKLEKLFAEGKFKFKFKTAGSPGPGQTFSTYYVTEDGLSIRIRYGESVQPPAKIFFFDPESPVFKQLYADLFSGKVSARGFIRPIRSNTGNLKIVSRQPVAGWAVFEDIQPFKFGNNEFWEPHVGHPINSGSIKVSIGKPSICTKSDPIVECVSPEKIDAEKIRIDDSIKVADGKVSVAEKLVKSTQEKLYDFDMAERKVSNLEINVEYQSQVADALEGSRNIDLLDQALENRIIEARNKLNEYIKELGIAENEFESLGGRLANQDYVSARQSLKVAREELASLESAKKRLAPCAESLEPLKCDIKGKSKLDGKLEYREYNVRILNEKIALVEQTKLEDLKNIITGEPIAKDQYLNELKKQLETAKAHLKTVQVEVGEYQKKCASCDVAKSSGVDQCLTKDATTGLEKQVEAKLVAIQEKISSLEAQGMSNNGILEATKGDLKEIVDLGVELDKGSGTICGKVFSCLSKLPHQSIVENLLSKRFISAGLGGVVMSLVLETILTNGQADVSPQHILANYGLGLIFSIPVVGEVLGVITAPLIGWEIGTFIDSYIQNYDAIQAKKRAQELHDRKMDELVTPAEAEAQKFQKIFAQRYDPKGDDKLLAKNFVADFFIQNWIETGSYDINSESILQNAHFQWVLTNRGAFDFGSRKFAQKVVDNNANLALVLADVIEDYLKIRIMTPEVKKSDQPYLESAKKMFDNLVEQLDGGLRYGIFTLDEGPDGPVSGLQDLEWKRNLLAVVARILRENNQCAIDSSLASKGWSPEVDLKNSDSFKQSGFNAHQVPALARLIDFKLLPQVTIFTASVFDVIANAFDSMSSAGQSVFDAVKDVVNQTSSSQKIELALNRKAIKNGKEVEKQIGIYSATVAFDQNAVYGEASVLAGTTVISVKDQKVIIDKEYAVNLDLKKVALVAVLRLQPEDMDTNLYYEYEKERVASAEQEAVNKVAYDTAVKNGDQATINELKNYTIHIPQSFPVPALAEANDLLKYGIPKSGVSHADDNLLHSETGSGVFPLEPTARTINSDGSVEFILPPFVSPFLRHENDFPADQSIDSKFKDDFDFSLEVVGDFGELMLDENGVPGGSGNDYVYQRIFEPAQMNGFVSRADFRKKIATYNVDGKMKKRLVGKDDSAGSFNAKMSVFEDPGFASVVSYGQTSPYLKTISPMYGLQTDGAGYTLSGVSEISKSDYIELHPGEYEYFKNKYKEEHSKDYEELYKKANPTWCTNNEPDIPFDYYTFSHAIGGSIWHDPWFGGLGWETDGARYRYHPEVELPIKGIDGRDVRAHLGFVTKTGQFKDNYGILVDDSAVAYRQGEVSLQYIVGGMAKYPVPYVPFFGAAGELLGITTEEKGGVGGQTTVKIKLPFRSAEPEYKYKVSIEPDAMQHSDANYQEGSLYKLIAKVTKQEKLVNNELGKLEPAGNIPVLFQSPFIHGGLWQSAGKTSGDGIVELVYVPDSSGVPAWQKEGNAVINDQIQVILDKNENGKFDGEERGVMEVRVELRVKVFDPMEFFKNTIAPTFEQNEVLPNWGTGVYAWKYADPLGIDADVDWGSGNLAIKHEGTHLLAVNSLIYVVANGEVLTSTSNHLTYIIEIWLDEDKNPNYKITPINTQNSSRVHLKVSGNIVDLNELFKRDKPDYKSDASLFSKLYQEGVLVKGSPVIQS